MGRQGEYSGAGRTHLSPGGYPELILNIQEFCKLLKIVGDLRLAVVGKLTSLKSAKAANQGRFALEILMDLPRPYSCPDAGRHRAVTSLAYPSASSPVNSKCSIIIN